MGWMVHTLWRQARQASSRTNAGSYEVMNCTGAPSANRRHNRIGHAERRCSQDCQLSALTYSPSATTRSPDCIRFACPATCLASCIFPQPALDTKCLPFRSARELFCRNSALQRPASATCAPTAFLYTRMTSKRSFPASSRRWDRGIRGGAVHTTSMKSLTRDNGRFSHAADWSLNATVPQATAGNRYSIPPRPCCRNERETELMGRVNTRTRAAPCGR